MPEPVRLTALPKEGVVRLLKQAGSTLAAEVALEADIAAGAPVNDDGTMNLLEYAAWLLRESGHAD